MEGVGRRGEGGGRDGEGGPRRGGGGHGGAGAREGRSGLPEACVAGSAVAPGVDPSPPASRSPLPPRRHGRLRKVNAPGAADHPSRSPAFPPRPCPRPARGESQSPVNKRQGPHPGSEAQQGGRERDRHGPAPPPSSPALRNALLRAPPARLRARVSAAGRRLRSAAREAAPPLPERGGIDTSVGGVSRRTVRSPRAPRGTASPRQTEQGQQRKRRGRGRGVRCPPARAGSAWPSLRVPQPRPSAGHWRYPRPILGQAPAPGIPPKRREDPLRPRG